VTAGPPRATAEQEGEEEEEGERGGRPFGEAIAQLRLIQKLTSPSAKVHLVWLHLLWLLTMTHPEARRLQPCVSRLQPCVSRLQPCESPIGRLPY
jgi:hypothetical protein